MKITHRYRQSMARALVAACLVGACITAGAATYSAPAPHLSGGNASAVIPKPVALRPVIVVTGAHGAIQNSCQSPKPAVIATVNLRNTGGGALAANQGTVYVSEDNGSPDRLVSGGVQLPAFAPGEAKAVSIPVISLSPYSKLPGSHVLTVHLLPLMSNGQYSFPKPATDYQFTITFPNNYCQGK
jgi:hypothetical protein